MEGPDGAVCAQIAAAETVAVPLQVTEVPAQEVSDILSAAACQPFDLEQGPLLRGQLLLTGQQSSTLMLAMHHAVGDAWSVVSKNSFGSALPIG